MRRGREFVSIIRGKESTLFLLVLVYLAKIEIEY